MIVVEAIFPFSLSANGYGPSDAMPAAKINALSLSILRYVNFGFPPRVSRIPRHSSHATFVRYAAALIAHVVSLGAFTKVGNSIVCRIAVNMVDNPNGVVAINHLPDDAMRRILAPHYVPAQPSFVEMCERFFSCVGRIPSTNSVCFLPSLKFAATPKETPCSGFIFQNLVEVSRVR